MTGDAYNNIGKMFEEQPKLDWEPLADKMHIYKGKLASFPDILQVHKVRLTRIVLHISYYKVLFSTES
jgi:sorting nexin-9/18/33